MIYNFNCTYLVQKLLIHSKNIYISTKIINVNILVWWILNYIGFGELYSITLATERSKIWNNNQGMI